MKVTVSERDIQYAILDWLNAQPGCVAWVNETTGIWDKSKGIYRKNPRLRKGVSDILGIWYRCPLAVEVKTPKGRVSVEQEMFLKDFVHFGGIGFVARSIDETKEQLRAFRQRWQQRS